ncbi:acyltransferase family protein [Novosphingobium mangrovi (ex Hu et al. 2023)]|uniref:Acyltransferase n=1 Tax=Novosphingobium mangrovi (ex Hu et al. 2023) TaxID=2930094 RepID=A0ABT0AIA0_9SPHN|nr:acyltransferase [Novosphingobium mangrovi (ex Hu et al. 2023)]MCJ1962865.1 acyltransferase [Novosphingobium mangrovi (ex Hu et al. 2023)]
MTLSEQLTATRGRPAGFDYLRIALAAMIVVWHTAITSYGTETQTALALGPSRPIWAAILPMFFALSGFLVSGSLERSRTLISFLGLRVLRIFPALAVESLIAMLVIGPLFTAYALDLYFTDPVFQRYALNMLGIVQYDLPGVFLANPATQVNAQLWTLPFELKCYIAIALFYIFQMYRVPALFVFGCIALQIAASAWIVLDPQQDEGILRGPVLVLAFLYGSLLYRLRDRLPWSPGLCVVAALVSLVLLYMPLANSLAALPLAYVTVYLGLTNPPCSSLVSSGDYSYGIFLYGFPIQQAVSATLPDLRFWWVNLFVATPIICLIAYGSWHLIEKKALRLRGYLTRFEDWCLPHHDRIAGFYGRTITASLQSRWVPRRLQQTNLVRALCETGRPVPAE